METFSVILIDLCGGFLTIDVRTMRIIAALNVALPISNVLIHLPTPRICVLMPKIYVPINVLETFWKPSVN